MADVTSRPGTPPDPPVDPTAVDTTAVDTTPDDNTAGGARLDPELAARLKRDSAGLVAAIVQDHDTREVLMLGWMDDEALRRTLAEGRVTYWSRSRAEYWRKGDTSGHTQHLRAISLDCDGDALLLSVDQ